MTIFHFLSFIPSYLHLNPVLSPLPSGLYFIQSVRPQVGRAVLVRLGTGYKHNWPSKAHQDEAR